MTTVTIPQWSARFAAYHAQYPVWGALHIVMEDGNVSDADVAHCIEFAQQKGDAEGEALARVLLSMSKTQRRKLSRLPEVRNARP